MGSKVFFVTLFLFFTFLLAGQEIHQGADTEKKEGNFSLGLELLIDFDVYERTIFVTGTQTERVYPLQLDVTLTPTLHIRLNDNFEAAPYILGRYEVERDEYNAQNSNPEVHKDLNRLSFGAGCGLYWKFIETRIIDLHTGFRSEIRAVFPSWGESAPTGYYNFDPGTGAVIGIIDIPVAMEINPVGDFRMRLWLRVLRFGILIHEDYYRENVIEQTVSVFSSSPFWLNDNQAISLSFIFPLGNNLK